MKKSNLDARIRNYEKQVAGGTQQGRRVQAVDSRAFHKPGSNKK
jgi:hypothetical protein